MKAPPPLHGGYSAMLLNKVSVNTPLPHHDGDSAPLSSNHLHHQMRERNINIFYKGAGTSHRQQDMPVLLSCFCVRQSCSHSPCFSHAYVTSRLLQSCLLKSCLRLRQSHLLKFRLLQSHLLMSRLLMSRSCFTCQPLSP